MARRIGLALLLFLSMSIPSVEAQYRHHYRSSSYHQHATVVALAQKKQFISMLQMQVASANQVLVNAESKSSMSQSSAYDAMNKLNQIRREIETASAEAHDAFKELQMIEADILEAQSDHSEFAVATKAVNESTQEVHRVFHVLAQIPEEQKKSTEATLFVEMSRLSESQRSSIKENSDFKFAKDQLASTEQHVLDVRKKLFENSKEWKNAKRTFDKARQDSQSETAKAKPATAIAAHQNQDAQQLKNIVSNAKLIIAQGETRLRQLGAKPLSSSYGKR